MTFEIWAIKAFCIRELVSADTPSGRVLMNMSFLEERIGSGRDLMNLPLSMLLNSPSMELMLGSYSKLSFNLNSLLIRSLTASKNLRIMFLSSVTLSFPTFLVMPERIHFLNSSASHSSIWCLFMSLKATSLPLKSFTIPSSDMTLLYSTS